MSFPVKIGKYADSCAEKLWIYRHGNIIHCSALVALEAIQIGEVHTGNKNNCSLLISRMLPNHVRQLEAVNFWHAHIHQDDGNIFLEQMFERFPARIGLD